MWDDANENAGREKVSALPVGKGQENAKREASLDLAWQRISII